MKIIYEIAFIESALDDPEHISWTDMPEELAEETRANDKGNRAPDSLHRRMEKSCRKV